MAAPLDVLMRPVKFVKEAGGDFLVLTSDGTAYLIDAEEGSITKIDLPRLSVGPIVRCTGGSYHEVDGTDVFLIAGLAVDDDTGGYAAGVCVSNDTESWSVAYERVDPLATIMGGAIVWSGGAFHHSYGFKSITEEGGIFTANSDEYEVSSANGESWSGASVVKSGVTDEHQGYRSPFPAAHCKHNDCVDCWGQNVPDGFMYQDPDDPAVFIRPTAPAPMAYSTGQVAYFDTWEFVPSSSIENATGDVTETINLGSNIFCVASNGTAIAAGGQSLYLSTGDDDFEEITLGEDAGLVVNITAIPRQSEE